MNGQPAIKDRTLSQCSFGDAVYMTFGFHCADGTAEVRYDDIAVDYP